MLKQLNNTLYALKEQAATISKDVKGVERVIALIKHEHIESATPTEAVKQILGSSSKGWWQFRDLLNEVIRCGVSANMSSIKTTVFSVINKLYNSAHVERRGRSGQYMYRWIRVEN